MKVSIGLCHFLVHNFALCALTLVLTLMNSGPSNPLTIPRITAPNITSVGVTSRILIFPNLREDAVHPSKWPCAAASVNASVTTAKLHDKNVFQSIENFQYVLGLDSSKMKRAPPMGAENAAATPADAPAEMNYLLL